MNTLASTLLLFIGSSNLGSAVSSSKGSSVLSSLSVLLSFGSSTGPQERAASVPVAQSVEAALDDPAAVFPEATALTHGPKFHWFGYYDKLQTDPSGRYVLGMAVDFEHRSPTENDEIEIGFVDREEGNRWVRLGSSRAWCWQQGCMLQWRPGSDREVIWNDRLREEESAAPAALGGGVPFGPFVARLLDVQSGELRTLPAPIYHLSADGRSALTLDFARVQAMRPGYGYAGPALASLADPAPANDGVWLMDLDTGERELLLSIADVVAHPVPNADLDGDVHYFNHLQWSPDSKRFFFLHRWRSTRFSGFRTRALTAAAFVTKDATAANDRWTLHDARVLSDAADLSHFEWRDATHLVIWREGAYRLFTDDGSGEETVLWRAPNGHHRQLPDPDWWVSDTYPRGRDRLQTPYLFQLSTATVIPLGRFASPSPYAGEWRCDLHPRLDATGRRVVFDSPHGGEGRQLWSIDLGPILDRAARPRLPRVLLLGDSISLGYTPFVKAMLEGEAEVFRATTPKGRPENCSGTTFGKANVARWLLQDGGNFDLVHFNFGLHDLKRVDPTTGAGADDAQHPRQAGPELYEQQLRDIVHTLQASGASLVLATTTPVPEGPVRPFRDPADVERYNAIARQLAAEMSIAVDDLCSAVGPRCAKLQQPVNVHFTEAGSRFLAESVVRSIRETLARRR